VEEVYFLGFYYQYTVTNSPTLVAISFVIKTGLHLFGQATQAISKYYF